MSLGSSVICGVKMGSRSRQAGDPILSEVIFQMSVILSLNLKTFKESFFGLLMALTVYLTHSLDILQLLENFKIK